MQLVEERAPNGFNVVTEVMTQQELEDVANTYKRVAGFQVEALNAKPPIAYLMQTPWTSNDGNRPVTSSEQMLRGEPATLDIVDRHRAIAGAITSAVDDDDRRSFGR